MKHKISVRLPELVAKRLEAAAAAPGARKSSIVEAALDLFLETDTTDSAIARHLKRISRRLDELESDLKIVAETVALHARFHLTVTPALPVVDQPGVCAIGRERFEEFAAQVARRVHLDNPLMKETMDRILATRPNLFANDLERDTPPLGVQWALDADRLLSVAYSYAFHEPGRWKWCPRVRPLIRGSYQARPELIPSTLQPAACGEDGIARYQQRRSWDRWQPGTSGAQHS
jgi:hypothetical protein